MALTTIHSQAHLVALAGVAVMAGLAPPASAGTLSAVLQDDRNPGQLLEYAGGPGEANRLSVELSRDSALVTDPAGITPGPGCSAVPGQPSQATCAREGYYRYLEVDLGDGDDEIVALAPGLSATIQGGSGNDALRGVPTTRGSVDELFLGESLDGGPGDDLLISGPVRSTLSGGVGRDRVQGGGGRDFISEGFDDESPDVLDGGPGRDLLDYVGRGKVDLRVTLDGVADDGARGEGDAISAIEDVTGSLGDDELRGNAETNRLSGGVGADRLAGGPGGDSLRGGDGGDRLVGGPGADALLGGRGDDTLLARDSYFDQLACERHDDRAIVDTLDMTYARGGFGECEEVRRSGTPVALPIGTSTPTSFKLTLVTFDASRRVQTEVGCPSDMGRSCSGVLRVRYRGRVVAAAGFVLRAGRSKRLARLATVRFHRAVGDREGVPVSIEVSAPDRSGRLRTVRAQARTG